MSHNAEHYLEDVWTDPNHEYVIDTTSRTRSSSFAWSAYKELLAAGKIEKTKYNQGFQYFKLKPNSK